MKYRVSVQVEFEADIILYEVEHFEDLQKLAEGRLNERLRLATTYASEDCITNITAVELVDWDRQD